MYKTLIFDFDGTLADTIPTIVEEVKKEAKKRNIKVPPKKVWQTQSIYKTIKDAGISTIRSYFLYKKIKEEISPKLTKCKMFKNLPVIIRKLQKKYTVIIVSSGTTDTITKILEPYKLKIPIVTTNLNKVRALKTISKSYEDCIHIGDEVRDIKAARKAKMHVASVTWGLNNKKSLTQEKPNLLFEKPKDIENAMLFLGKHS